MGQRNSHEDPAPGPHVRTMAGREILFDSEGFLDDYDQWSEDVCLILAKECGLDRLDDKHWRVIRFLRKFYLENGRAPLNRQLKGGCGMGLLEMEGLFPEGLKNGARRLAGLPNPKTCA